MAITKSKAEVLENNLIDGSVRWVKFKLIDPLEISFQAGQYCTYIINDTTRRSYSFCSNPSQKSVIEVCVDTSPQGAGSQWLGGLKPGDKLEFLGPLGGFGVDKSSEKEIVFMATGTGISPIRSMIADLLNKGNGGNEGDGGKLRKITLIFGVRDEEHKIFFEEFEKYVRENTNFSFFPIMSRPKGEWKGRVGHVNDLISANNQQLIANSRFYLCGNRDMIEGVKKQLLDLGVKIEDIHREQFY